jgi:hypothetical protein
MRARKVVAAWRTGLVGQVTGFWWIAGAWVAFGLIAVVSSVLVLHRPQEDRLSDLHIYYGAIRAAASGRPLYEYVAENGGPFTYPPFAALLLRPIIAVPEPALRVIWLVLTCAAVAGIAASVGRALARESGRDSILTGQSLITALAACVLLLSAPAQSNLRFGQVSVFVVLLTLVDAVGATPRRYRGLLIGVAAAIKLTPLLFLVFFLVVGRYRVATRALGGFVACGLLAALVSPGDSRTYWTGMVAETSRIGDLASLGNQSVHGMLLRIGVAPHALPAVWLGLVAFICGTALLRARRIYLDGQPVRAAVLVGCATLAGSPVSWTHHQLWTVLAAMLLLATTGQAHRVAGAILLASMVISLGSLLGSVSTYQGIQFLLENLRGFAPVAICLCGLGGAAAVAVSRPLAVGRGVNPHWLWLRAGAVGVVVLAGFAVVPLPAAADPTFKAYGPRHATNSRYFFFCRTREQCAELSAAGPIRFGFAHEKTKVRVNGVIDGRVARLEFRSAPGGSPRKIPLVEIYPGQRAFSFRSANLSHGLLTVFGPGDQLLVAYPMRSTTRLISRTR